MKTNIEKTGQKGPHSPLSGGASIGELIEQNRQKVFNYIFSMVKNRQVADDLVQETFIKVLNSFRAGSYVESGKFISWTMRIAHNQVIDYFRSNKKVVHITPEDTPYELFPNDKQSDPNIEDRMIKEQIDAEIRTLIDLLPQEQREVVVLRHYEDLSFKEISEQTGVSINTALGRMRYALINLRKMIEQKQLSLV